MDNAKNTVSTSPLLSESKTGGKRPACVRRGERPAGDSVVLACQIKDGKTEVLWKSC